MSSHFRLFWTTHAIINNCYHPVSHLWSQVMSQTCLEGKQSSIHQTYFMFRTSTHKRKLFVNQQFLFFLILIFFIFFIVPSFPISRSYSCWLSRGFLFFRFSVLYFNSLFVAEARTINIRSLCGKMGLSRGIITITPKYFFSSHTRDQLMDGKRRVIFSISLWSCNFGLIL